MVTLCSYNIRFILDRWDERRPFLEKELTATNADVFALQEVNIGQRYGQHTQLQETLSTALNTTYSVFASPGARWYIERIPYLGVLMSGAKNPLAQWAYDGYAWFNERFLASILGRHTQTVYHNEWLRVLLYGLLGSGWVFGTSLLARDDKSPENNDILLIGDWRAAQCVEITLENKHKMLITNVHLSSAPDQEDIRKNEMQLVFDWIQEKLEANPELQTAIIMGDFNCHPNGECYNFITSQGYKSAYYTLHGKEPEVTFHQGLEAPTKDVGEPCTLDYIFIKGDQVQVDAIKVIGQSQCDQDSTLYPSDHFGLVEPLYQAAGKGMVEMTSPNPFQRFAFRRDSPVKKEENTAVKRECTDEGNPTTKKTKGRLSREEMLEQLLRARQDIVAHVDVFGTQQLFRSTMSPKDQRWQILIAALLSTQTKDKITAAAMARLHQLDNGLTISSILELTVEKLDQLLVPVGFHKKKAEQILRIATILNESYDGDIPDTIPDLMRLPGVGPKVARLILLVAWDKVDGIIVDTHVHRISRRLGWTSEGATTPEASRRELEEWIPREHWPSLSKALIGFGQSYCSALHPKCRLCPLRSDCPSCTC